MTKIYLPLLTILLASTIAQAETSDQVREQFANPSRDYTSGPLWVWNDMLTEEQIRGALQDLAAQNVRQPFVHPRPGLMTPYLSDDWFRLWKVALDEAEKLDMNIWIYDENSYPSGFAGGFVPDAMPEARGVGLKFKKVSKPRKIEDSVVRVYLLEEDKAKDITEALRKGKTFKAGQYLIIEKEPYNTSPWYGGKSYVDLLKPGVTEKFLEITMGAYKREIGDEFGKRVPGVFTDEPHLRGVGTSHWSEDLPDEFEQRWGYSLMDNLASLAEPVGDWKKVRHNYYQTLLDLFIERWAKPYYEYCEANDLDFTGHYWEHGWPGAEIGPDNMAMSAWQQRPGIDTLFNQYSEGPGAQFGNVRAALELQSVANQMGWERTLCEAYGGSGWDARLEDFKRIGDWLYVLGINTLNQHLTHSTLRGARKRDYPPSFSYHTPWWDAYGAQGDYFARLTLALTQGQMKNKILVIEPTTTGWMYQTSSRNLLDRMGQSFQKLVTDLAQAQVEFDIGSEDIMMRNGAVEGKKLRVGKQTYHTVVIPPRMENLNAATAKLLQQYLDAGGTVFACDKPELALIDGQASKQAKALTAHKGWQTIKTTDAVDTLLKRDNNGFLLQVDGKGIPYHHRRQLDDGDFLFIVNTSMQEPVTGTIASPMKGAQEWNLRTAEVSPYFFTATSKGIKTTFELPPCGSLLLFLSKEASNPKVVQYKTADTIAPSGDMTIQRDDLNVLTLDYLDLTIKGETHKDMYYHKANTMVWQAHGHKVNPWDHAVQFGDELISQTFPEGGGFEATYHFVIEDGVPESLYVVIERDDLYTITCNGKPVSVKDGAWWLDKAFGKIDIAKQASVGENTVTITANTMSMFHELEAAYLLGNFDLKAVERGFVVVPETKLKLGPWTQQGMPLYSHGVTYAQSFVVDGVKAQYEVVLPDWYGSVAKVEVNGKACPVIYNQPYASTVTEAIKPGKNTIAVTVIGTLKNTLGPHHGNPGLGFAGPGSFHSAPSPGPVPGKDYSIVDYGLFAPFELQQKVEG